MGRFLFHMDQQWLDRFRDQLDRHHAWPSLYMFKFIVPHGKEDSLKELFPNHTVTQKASKHGKYSSLTVQMMLPSSEAVIAIYLAASKIEGIIAL